MQAMLVQIFVSIMLHSEISFAQIPNDPSAAIVSFHSSTIADIKMDEALAPYKTVIGDPQTLVFMLEAADASAAEDIFSRLQFAEGPAVKVIADSLEFRVVPLKIGLATWLYFVDGEVRIFKQEIHERFVFDVDFSEIEKGYARVGFKAPLFVAFLLKPLARYIFAKILGESSQANIVKMTRAMKFKNAEDVAGKKIELANMALNTDGIWPKRVCEPGAVAPFRSQLRGYILILAWGLIVPMAFGFRLWTIVRSR